MAAWFIGDTIVIVLLHMDYEVIGIQNMDIIKTPDESRTLKAKSRSISSFYFFKLE